MCVCVRVRPSTQEREGAGGGGGRFRIGDAKREEYRRLKKQQNKKSGGMETVGRVRWQRGMFL